MKLQVWLMLASLMCVSGVQAQVQAPHVCGAGPGPNEVMAGMHPGGNGVAPTPLCYWKPQPVQEQYQAPIKLPDAYASFVADLDGYKLYWSTFARSGEEAERIAMEHCRNNGGKNCQPRGWFSNQCGAIAVNPTGKIFEGYGVHPLIAAQKGLRECNEATEGAVCLLKDLPICSMYENDGTTRIADLANRNAHDATQEDIERFSEIAGGRAEPRSVTPPIPQGSPVPRPSGYWEKTWGAIATPPSHGGVTGIAVGAHSQRDAERLALADCKAKGGGVCSVKLSYLNQCAVMTVGSGFSCATSAESIERATEIGMADCRKRGVHCRVEYSGCTEPIFHKY